MHLKSYFFVIKIWFPAEYLKKPWKINPLAAEARVAKLIFIYVKWLEKDEETELLRAVNQQYFKWKKTQLTDSNSISVRKAFHYGPFRGSPYTMYTDCSVNLDVCLAFV